MKIFLAALVIALLAGPAFAQSKNVPKYGELDGKKPHEIKAEKEAEAPKAAVRRKTAAVKRGARKTVKRARKAA